MTPTLEQMELAAKSIGLVRHGSAFADTFLVKKTRENASAYGVEWNPLTSGDDSQRLQVKLRIDVDWFDKRTSVQAWMEGFIVSCIPNPSIPDDDLRAMKEAIFLVAVEIGRAMK